LSVKGTDPELRARQTDIVPAAGARRINAAVPIRSNLLRLEHELQTVVDGSACAAAITLSAYGIGDTASVAHIAAGTRAARSAPAALLL
jgi:hypothetical protein